MLPIPFCIVLLPLHDQRFRSGIDAADDEKNSNYSDPCFVFCSYLENHPRANIFAPGCRSAIETLRQMNPLGFAGQKLRYKARKKPLFEPNGIIFPFID